MLRFAQPAKSQKVLPIQLKGIDVSTNLYSGPTKQEAFLLSSSYT